MQCERAQILMQAYLDDELDADTAAQMASHLLTCRACGAGFAELQALRTALQWHGTHFAAPASLRARVRTALRDAQPARRTLSGWPWARINLAAAAAASAAFVAMLALYLGQPSSAERLDQEVVASHYRSLMSGRPADVASSDQHTVKPWFAGKLDFSPPVHELAPYGFVLVGGRVDYVGGRPVAALAYRHGRHLLDLYVWPAPGAPDQAPHASSVQGFQLLGWSARQMRFIAISDMNPQDLAAFAQALRAQAGPR